eukprot:1319478-Alexandrium_andersonii.AAC.1
MLFLSENTHAPELHVETTVRRARTRQHAMTAVASARAQRFRSPRFAKHATLRFRRPTVQGT